MKKTYFGILPNLDFDKIGINELNLLVEHNVFYSRKLSDTYKYDDDYFLKDSDKMSFGNFFIQDRKEYHLKNEVYSEIYFLDAEKIKLQSQLSYHINKIEYEVDSEEYVGSKYSILEKYYKLYRDKIDDLELYLLYQDISTYESCEGTCSNFYEYYVVDFNANEDYTGVGDYLNGIDRFYNVEFRQEWGKMYLVRGVSQFCLNKMKDLRQQIIDESLKESQEALAQEIFKDDGLRMFEHIVSKYQKQKTKAFFSYLYFFLQNKYKMQNFSSDSVLYRNYVINNGYLPDFPRIIVTQSEKQTAKDKIESNFKKLLESYSK
ncbi:hypothetical protein [Flavobacterium sp.]|jgi:hypothetical protein|uniref:hypothetical protein n=1 Tax=Flavobacterium sp. TaxID=239 RepID=UPI0037BEA255